MEWIEREKKEGTVLVLVTESVASAVAVLQWQSQLQDSLSHCITTLSFLSFGREKNAWIQLLYHLHSTSTLRKIIHSFIHTLISSNHHNILIIRPLLCSFLITTDKQNKKDSFFLTYFSPQLFHIQLSFLHFKD
ncbi:hypothetical protein VIGAN_11253900 [Vigna angularis var. angularis]|uniref:Uncharacterized protein n=1 Tax=Vigna angularis var. angularis TaxID=157739 RepID=A0A0S3TCR3_PHAAN|nr:hypothetical protein VIGAN_11253900 [Vigna angularis var. angularis]